MAAARAAGAPAALTTQAEFLHRLGIAERAQALANARPNHAPVIERQLHRLVGPDQMGELFKACCLYYPEGLATPGFEEAEVSDLPVLQSPLLAAIPGVRHAFFTRQGGVSAGIYASLNVGRGSNDDPAAVEENRRRCAEYLGFEEAALSTCYQSHTANALIARRALRRKSPQGGRRCHHQAWPDLRGAGGGLRAGAVLRSDGQSGRRRPRRLARRAGRHRRVHGRANGRAGRERRRASSRWSAPASGHVPTRWAWTSSTVSRPTRPRQTRFFRARASTPESACSTCPASSSSGCANPGS